MDNQLAKLIKDLEVELLQPDVRKSTHRLNELLADDFLEFGASGNRYNKHDILEHLPKLVQAKYTVHDFATVQISPNTILATYRVEKEVLDSGEKSFSLRSSLW
ncbi:unnamed protein product, partial [marine sediment metagenome]